MLSSLLKIQTLHVTPCFYLTMWWSAGVWTLGLARSAFEHHTLSEIRAGFFAPGCFGRLDGYFARADGLLPGSGCVWTQAFHYAKT